VTDGYRDGSGRGKMGCVEEARVDIGKPRRVITVEPEQAPAVEPAPVEPAEEPVPAAPRDA
jgi:hypothetical protein